MNFDVLAPTLASLLLGALSLLMIFLLSGVDWERLKSIFTKPDTLRSVLIRLDDRLTRKAKYWRVRYSQASVQERVDIGLWVAVVLLLLDLLIVAAK